MITALIFLITGTLLAGVLLGWLGNFIKWWISKGNFRQAWLLCKPWRLSDKQKYELALFYVHEFE